MNKGEWRSFVKRYGKEAALTSTTLVVMLLPGIMLDNIYLGNWKWQLGTKLLDCLRKLSVFGITHDNAFRILGNNVGVLMTLVSMFLSMNINIAERSEKKIFGIPRKELSAIRNGCIYRCIRRMNYIAPVLMITFLNLSYCVSGYLLFGYCFSFLILHYCIHESSFSREENPKKVAKKLLSYFPTQGKWSDEMILRYRILLESVGKSVEEEGNWQEAEVLFHCLTEMAQEYDDKVKYLVCYYFCQSTYCRQKRRQNIAFTYLLKTYVEKSDRSATQKDVGLDWPVFLGILKPFIYESDEEELTQFLRWFLNYADRSREALRRTGKGIPCNYLDEQTAMLLLLLECRLQQKGMKSGMLEEQIRHIWNNGKRAFFNPGVQLKDRIYSLKNTIFQGIGESEDEILTNLESDYINNTKKSLIANIVSE